MAVALAGILLALLCTVLAVFVLLKRALPLAAGAVLLLVAVLTAALAFTGWLGYLRGTGTISGNALNLHVPLGAALTASAVLFGVLAAPHCFGFRTAPDALVGRLGAVCIWVLLGGVLVSGTTIVLAMFPLAGTNGQHALVSAHVTGGLVSLGALVLLIGSLLVQRTKTPSTHIKGPDQ